LWKIEENTRIGHKIQCKWTNWLNFSGSYTFIDRSKGSQRLLVILAGYKDFLWSLTLDRMARFLPPDIDVCVVSSGLFSSGLVAMAERFGWSYLYTEANKVSLVQNLAVSLHTQANWIYKLDEDIFISEGFFDSLLDGYLQIAAEGLYNPGFCSPVVNVNGYSYITFLKSIAAEEEYRARFGELKYAANGIKAYAEGEAAKWLWQKSLPFDEVAGYMRSQPFNYSGVPHRFSIGAILFERKLWETVGGLRCGLRNGGLGLDEEYLCKDCLELSRPIFVIHNVFAGHFSFGPQTKTMIDYFPTIYSQLCVRETVKVVSAVA
jgi:hypothetical protein